jgi:hypothetical protein
MKPIAWSHSALTDFNNCPKAFYEKRIAKSVVDPPNEAGLWGDYVHREFEKYLNTSRPGHDQPRPLPADLELYRAYLDRVVASPGEMYVECKYAIDTNMQPCDFFAPNVWCRAIIDVLHINGQVARVIDHKTGKRKLDTRQLKLNALMVFIHHPNVMMVRTGYMWLQDEKLDTEDYVRANEHALWAEFMPDLVRFKTAFKQEIFVPRQSGLCNGWCPVTSCEFWKPKKTKR